MSRPLVPWPHELLGRKCLPIEHWNEHLKVLVRELEDTATHVGGDMVSLSAPQIGSPMRVIYIGKGITKTGQALTLINPEMIEHKDELQVIAEQCLSLPGIELNIQRYKDITIRAKNPRSDEVTVHADGMLAQALQHELNHLEGRTIAECCNPVKRKYLAERQLERFNSGLTV